tara:strand:+ start:1559 stop:1750 length:192 start_codon:yes stop_codon:yes gene_type:complete
MTQLNLFTFKSVEPESDIEKLAGMVHIDTVDMDIIDLDIQTAEETGDYQRLSQLLEIKKSIVE